MKPGHATNIAIWLLEHLSLGVDTQSLCGDLLEQRQGGRSELWLWCQVLVAIFLGLVQATGRYAVPVIFSAGWSIVYPAWAQWGPGRFTAAVLKQAETMSWPYSSLAPLIQGLLPVISFRGLGCISQPDFYSVLHLSAINLPIAMGVLCAVLCVLPQAPRPPRRRRRIGPARAKSRNAVRPSEMRHPA